MLCDMSVLNPKMHNKQTNNSFLLIIFFACGVFIFKYVVYMMSVLDSKMK